MAEYIEREAILRKMQKIATEAWKMRIKANVETVWNEAQDVIRFFPAAEVRPVAEIEKIIESLQEQADIYNARAQELLVEEDGQVSQYTWAVSLRETYRRIIKTLDDLIS